MQKLIDGFLWAFIGVAACLTIFLNARHGSPIRATIDGYLQNRRTAEILARDWAKLDSSGSRIGRRGDANVIEFSDYECPFCRQSEAAVQSLAAKGSLRISYHHLPLSIHPAADGAARAAICSEAQGKFADMHRRLMETDQWQRDSNWVREAIAVGVADTAAFEECLSDSATSERIRRDIVLAGRLGVSGTPAFFSRTDKHQGAISVEAAQELIAGKP